MEEHVLTSGLLDAAAVIVPKRCLFQGIEVFTNGAADATATVYDDAAAAAGTVVAQCLVPGASLFGQIEKSKPIPCENGIYVDVGGAGMKYIVYYQPL